MRHRVGPERWSAQACGMKHSPSTKRRGEGIDHSSQRVVYVAIGANLAIMICKYVAAAVTGSSAMLAEAFHSTADAGNELLLLLGMKRSARPADALNPFGHGKDLD